MHGLQLVKRYFLHCAGEQNKRIQSQITILHLSLHHNLFVYNTLEVRQLTSGNVGAIVPLTEHSLDCSL